MSYQSRAEQKDRTLELSKHRRVNSHKQNKHHHKKHHTKTKKTSTDSSVIDEKESNQATVNGTSKISSDNISGENSSSNSGGMKEYVSYTSDGKHKLVQYNDAGHYLGDPDVQYETYKAQTDFENSLSQNQAVASPNDSH